MRHFDVIVVVVVVVDVPPLMMVMTTAVAAAMTGFVFNFSLVAAFSPCGEIYPTNNPIKKISTLFSYECMELFCMCCSRQRRMNTVTLKYSPAARFALSTQHYPCSSSSSPGWFHANNGTGPGQSLLARSARHFRPSGSLRGQARHNQQ